MDKKYSLVSININDFKNVKNINEFINNIKKYDIITIQQLYNKNILFMITNGYNYSYNKGILIMTKLNIKTINYKNKDQKFTSLIISIPYKTDILVTSVLLNDKHEDYRLYELNNIFKTLDYFINKYPSFLVGEFNSLTHNDYDYNMIEKITNHKIYNNMEQPIYTVTDKLNLEWFDCFNIINDKKINYIRTNYIYSKNIKILSYNIKNIFIFVEFLS